jgi:hypothetical protein
MGVEILNPDSRRRRRPVKSLTRKDPPPCWRWNRSLRARPIFKTNRPHSADRHGGDFSLYKIGTIKRRVARPEQPPQIESLQAHLSVNSRSPIAIAKGRVAKSSHHRAVDGRRPFIASSS